MIELVGAMIIISVLSIAGITAVNKSIQNSRYSAVEQDMSGFITPISQFIIENPQYSSFTITNRPEVLVNLNKYLEADMKYKTICKNTTVFEGPIAEFELNLRDPWGTPYRLFISGLDNSNTGIAKKGVKDAEFRAWIVSNGPNRKTLNNFAAYIDGVDDIFMQVQSVNGEITVSRYGFPKNNTKFVTSESFKDNISQDIKGKSDMDGAVGVYSNAGSGNDGSIIRLYWAVPADTVMERIA